jgi:hypothetical protein
MLLRAILDDERRSDFRAHDLRRARTTFDDGLALRLERARVEGRLSDEQIASFLGRSPVVHAEAA